ncbi:hypothetical protein [Janibacter corallicola]|uniref:hypothetical protein n=1 Tax=Janibacter corallicola TaxID=415212 RepID=UPI000835C1FE|nr:hypothetical protein [Janibacter corallicola]
MYTTTAAPGHFEDVWNDVPRAFRQTHPMPLEGDRACVAAWGRGVRQDSANAAVAILDAAEAEVKRGDRAAADETAAAARPFRRLMTYLAMVDPLDRPCDECGAEPGAPGRPACTGATSTRTTN